MRFCPESVATIFFTIAITSGFVEFTNAIEPTLKFERDFALPCLTPHPVEEGFQFSQVRNALIRSDISLDKHRILPHELSLGIYPDPFNGWHRGRTAADCAEQLKTLQDPLALVSDLLPVTILVRDVNRERLRRCDRVGPEEPSNV